MNNQKIWSSITAILVTTLLGTTGSTTISSRAIASNTNTDEIAKTRTILEEERHRSIATIYTYQIGTSAAATLYVRNIPILTFLEKPDIATTNPLDPSFQAQQVADKINQLTESKRETSDITVSWEAKTKSYLIKINGEILTKIDETIRLADSTENLAEDALHATNRLRRLLSEASPMEEIIGLPKPESKPQQTADIKPKPQQAAAPKNRILRTISGLASWYGPGFHGRRTASGQIFNQHGLTAAHRSLPFGTRVRVTNVRNGRSTVVKINDRGPYSGGRIIDLSAGAARAIGLHSSGVGKVKVEVLGR
jgi:rare lipoprotein A